MASTNCFVLAIIMALSLLNINVGVAARHLLQMPPTLPGVSLPPLPSIPNLPQPTLPTTQPSLPKTGALPPLPSMPTLPALPKLAMPPIPTLPTTIPFFSPPPSKTSP